MNTTLTCPVCGRGSYLTAAGLSHHLTVDHSDHAVAECLAEVVLIVKAATSAPLPAVPPIPGPPGAVRCGKKCYPTERDALLGLLSTWATNLSWRRETRCYRCDRCNAWHLTSQASREDQAT